MNRRSTSAQTGERRRAGPGSGRLGRHRASRRGFTLTEVVIALALLGIALAVALPARETIDALALERTSSVAEAGLARARLLAMSRREGVQVRVGAGHRLVATDTAGGILLSIDLDEGSLQGLDSVRLRPATLRYNSRGHSGAASLYLYRGRRGARVISNFLGRTRRVTFRL